jgi:hypothetical protein
MMKEHEEVVLVRNLPKYGLKKGDLGTIIHGHRAKGYEVEFMTLRGETIAVSSLLKEEVRPISRREIPHAREIAAS